MAASSINRKGQGVVVMFVLWVIAVAFIYAFSQSQAQTGALTGVVRVAGLRLLQWAARSALNETAFKLALAAGEPAMAQLRQGQTPPPDDPVGTKEIYADAIARGELTISPVEVKLVGAPKPPESRDTWYFDASVKVEYRLGGSKLSKTVRRRLTGRQFLVKVTLGPPTTLPPTLVLDPGLLYEVME